MAVTREQAREAWIGMDSGKACRNMNWNVVREYFSQPETDLTMQKLQRIAELIREGKIRGRDSSPSVIWLAMKDVSFPKSFGLLYPDETGSTVPRVRVAFTLDELIERFDKPEPITLEQATEATRDWVGSGDTSTQVMVQYILQQKERSDSDYDI